MIRCECQCVCCDTQVFVLDDASGLASLRCPSCGRHLHARRIDPFGEAEWLSCTDPFCLIKGRRDWPSDRKCRLFACACCRLAWDELSDPRSRAAVEVAERLADGLAHADEVARARQAAKVVSPALHPGAPVHPAAAAWEALSARPAPGLAMAAVWQPPRQGDRERGARLAALFREIAGNPFRPSPPLTPTVLAWNDGTVIKLAQGIYEERAFERLPILADALEEAGCTDERLLEHLRGPGPHVRGCWAVDLVRSVD
jgi:hypothetical protein